ncbi:4-(cytidine 5'-diphospho)-2-C-methyl-D-erythritol kinase [Acidipila sp. EB88]|nr:4-(cytidine 5'-diphospho)-2-C-methyl-D-erythritol kinase [Acidipila sp. EB88]RRA50053.1 4-(cytidine 5'-diphospho)-2-C-methyl-D-erythritol kinase [Acidipila sp. EB88]
MPVTLRSHAKVNLGLAIGPTRPDGFHALATLYQTIEAHDLLTLSVTRDGKGANPVRLTATDRRIPLDGRNTVARMLTAALAFPGREGLTVRVHIDKRLPIQGGLGGGSGNAAAALVGLERELQRQGLAAPLAGRDRLRLAEEVGSDVPLFLLGGTVLGVGRGEEVVPLPDAGDLPAVVALPAEGVSTPAAFRAWDEGLAAQGLTAAQIADRLKELSRALAAAWCEQHATGVFSPHPQSPASPGMVAPGSRDLAGTLLSTLVQTGILLNDFEQVVFRQHPLLEQIKRVIAGTPANGQFDAAASASEAVYCALSGSGSAVFGLYASPDAADAAAGRLNRLGIRALRTRTLGRAEYWSGMVVHEE